MSPTVEVDAELALIIEEMKKDSMTDRAIRRYAQAFIGYNREDWEERYRERY